MSVIVFAVYLLLHFFVSSKPFSLILSIDVLSKEKTLSNRVKITDFSNLVARVRGKKDISTK